MVFLKFRQLQLNQPDCNEFLINTVLFETKIISYAIDKNDQTIEGNQDSPQSIIDSWVFERSIKSRDLNWILVSTNSDD